MGKELKTCHLKLEYYAHLVEEQDSIINSLKKDKLWHTNVRIAN